MLMLYVTADYLPIIMLSDTDSRENALRGKS